MMVRFAADSRDVTLRLTPLRSIDGGAVVDNPEEGKSNGPVPDHAGAFYRGLLHVRASDCRQADSTSEASTPAADSGLVASGLRPERELL